jgi:predicted nucleic acid-binding protein
LLADEAFVPQAEALRQEILQGRDTLVVPWIYRLEVASILSKAVDNGRIAETRAREAVAILIDIVHITVPPPEPGEAFDLARKYRRSVFDSFYLVIAEERGCLFWTDDRKLARALGPTHPFVRWIGEYPDPAAPAPA